MASPIDFIAGYFGGTAAVVVGHPLDTIKVIMQTSTKRVSMISVLRQMPILELYRGITAPLTGIAAINAIVFGVYGSLMRNTSDRSIMWNALAGCVAGLSQTLVTCPMELIKTRAQLSSLSVSSCFQQVLRHEGGSRGLYRGMMATMFRDAPAFATYFTCYELFLKFFNSSQSCPPSTYHLLLSGGLAGAASWLVVYPIDVVKSRIQANSKHVSIRECVKESYRHEGVRIFMRGAGPTLLRAFPTNAATFAVVSWTLWSYEQYERNTNIAVNQ